MSASAASMIGALITSPTSTGGIQAPGTAEGIFSALLGDIPAVATPLLEETATAPATFTEALTDLIAGNSTETLSPVQIDPADGLPVEVSANEEVLPEDPIVVSIVATQEIATTAAQRQSGSSASSAPTVAPITTIPIQSAPPALAGAETAGSQPLPGAGIPQQGSAAVSPQAMSTLPSVPPSPDQQAMLPAHVQTPTPTANSQNQAKKSQLNAAINAVRSSTSAAVTPKRPFASAFSPGHLVSASPGGLPADGALLSGEGLSGTGVSEGTISGQVAASLDGALAANNLRSGLPQAATPVASLAVQIASRAEQGARRFEIRMDPPELGRIDVRLKIDESGNVSTRLMVERPETLDLLQRDARALERALADAGLKTDEGGVRMSLRQDSSEQRAFSGSGDGSDTNQLKAENDNDSLDSMSDGDVGIGADYTRLAVNGALNIVV